MRTNRWHDAILKALRDAQKPLTVKQIAKVVEDTKFRHSSKWPENTINGRLTELTRRGQVVRTGVATFALQAPKVSS